MIYQLHPTTYYCQTITGQNRGAGLGFPTINIIPPSDFPYDLGIYAGWISIGNNLLKAAIHYGPTPVFNNTETSLEVHVINAQISERPEEVAIQLVTKIRDIKNFKTTQELKAQIKKDVVQIDSLLDILNPKN
ncbi:MAG: hypothetical protein COU10_01570 [Candidatus Harrisonbacteria bacterium CG10_big_fil_rev_8_21_14_0_10_45_28]|uniref:riboflavin kinase n=1 Tax=Candidatus Harrisonbacteria bacterium CG10_big_fil_rev_8_21_14_0_10_45_28 TaxID=1974586 RepID=A0A2H0UNL9_9BACT|nr:MAG: hypothetical protein COU10_01570 [Candidatus Harrisonbacteria bacterium CG10_big_fil_rev_8_21_14_0_10_45_28]